MYEHAVYGQSVPHAHIHFVPYKYHVLMDLREKIFKGLNSIPVDDIFQIKDIYKEEGSYFYLEEKGRKWIFHTKGELEGKYNFRMEFAKMTGLWGLSAWRTMPEEEKERNEEWVRETKERLKAV